MRKAKEYYLMHKDVPVCLMDITEEGDISRVRRNAGAADHFPIGGQMNDMKFHDWWRDRAIPKTRHGAQTALQKLGYATVRSALVNNLALPRNGGKGILRFYGLSDYDGLSDVKYRPAYE